MTPENASEPLRAPAETAVRQCLSLHEKESCAVVTDDDCRPVGDALYEAAKETTDDAVLLRYPPGAEHGEEPPGPVAVAMADADVVFAPTAKSLSHTRARSTANEAGARVATLPGITEDVFVTGLDADYETIAAECETMLDRVDDATEIRVTSEAGTDVTFRPGDRSFHADTGLVHEAGGMTNLPAGEVYVSPETADGRYVVDGTMPPHGLLPEGGTVEFEVEDGVVTAVSDDAVRDRLEAAAESVGRDAAYNLAELGIGTNLAVTELVGSVLLDEKAGGTVHIAVGDDHGIGGDVEAPVHLDGVLRDPTVTVDGTIVELPTV
jgi:leucyl aminopeptidase (aminopeptidase T)